MWSRKKYLQLTRPSGLLTRRYLDPPEQHENDDDDQDQAEAAARIVAPATAVGPARQGADQQEDEDDEEDGAEGHARSLLLEDAERDRRRTQDRPSASRSSVWNDTLMSSRFAWTGLIEEHASLRCS